jgi:hypothetical protein
MPHPDPFAVFSSPAVEEKKSIFSFAIRSKKKVVPKAVPVEKETEASQDDDQPTGPQATEEPHEAKVGDDETEPVEVEEVEEKHYISPFRRFSKQSNTAKPSEISKESAVKVPKIFTKLDSKHQRDIKALEMENKRLGDLKKQQEDALAKEKEEEEKRIEQDKQKFEELKQRVEEAKREAEGPKKEVPEQEEEKEKNIEEVPLATEGENAELSTEKASPEEDTAVRKEEPKKKSKKTSEGPKKHRFFGVFPVTTASTKNPDGTPMTVQDKIELKNKEHQSKLSTMKQQAEAEFNRVQNAFDTQISALKQEITKIEERIKHNEDSTEESITKAQEGFEAKKKELDEKHEEDKKNFFEETENKIKEKLEEVEKSKRDQEEAAEHLKELEEKQVESSEKLKVFEQDIQVLKLNISSEKGKGEDLNKEKEFKIQEIENLKKEREDHENKIKEAAETTEKSNKVISDFDSNAHQKDIDEINAQIEKLNKDLEETKLKSAESKKKSDELESDLQGKELDKSKELDNKAQLDTLHEAAETSKKETSKKVDDGQKELNALQNFKEQKDAEAWDVTSEPAVPNVAASKTEPNTEQSKATDSTTVLDSQDDEFKKEQEALLAKIEKARKEREILAKELQELDKNAYESLPKHVKV